MKSLLSYQHELDLSLKPNDKKDAKAYKLF